MLMNTFQTVKYLIFSGPSSRTVSRVRAGMSSFHLILLYTRNSSSLRFSGLITRFLPAIEAFFMVNSSSSEDSDDNHRIVQFAAGNKILL